jgi:DNA-binding CsgD family transcriptional regulator
MQLESLALNCQVEAWKSTSQECSLILIDASGRVLWTSHDLEEQPRAATHVKAIMSVGEVPQQWQSAILAIASQAILDTQRIVLLEKFDKSERFLAKFRCFEVGSARIFGLEVPCPVALTQIAREDLARATDMSPTEIKVLCHTLNGQTINDISGQLGITVETARTHMRRIYSKLGVNSRESLFSANAIFI